jgi:hypothetical protein
MSRTTIFEQQLQRLSNGQPATPATQGVDDLIAAAYANIQQNYSLGPIGTEAYLVGWSEYGKMDDKIASGEMSDTGKTQYVAAFRKSFGATVDSYESRMRSVIASVAAQVVPPSDFPPKDAATATHINGVMADFDSYDPGTAIRIAREAIARKDLPLVKRIADKLGALSAYKKPWVDNGVVSTVLDELKALLTSPSDIRSAAAAQWAEDAARDVTGFVGELRNGDGGVDPIDITVGVWPTIFNDRVAPQSPVQTRLARQSGRQTL